MEIADEFALATLNMLYQGGAPRRKLRYNEPQTEENKYGVVADSETVAEWVYDRVDALMQARKKFLSQHQTEDGSDI